MHQLSEFDEVLEALEGFKGVRKITGAKVSAISNWRARGGKFPARHYVVISDALAERRLKCAPELFTFKIKRTFKAKRNGRRKAA